MLLDSDEEKEEEKQSKKITKDDFLIVASFKLPI